jgi:hypothetical protein
MGCKKVLEEFTFNEHLNQNRSREDKITEILIASDLTLISVLKVATH